jgi:hypothetical protein
VQEHPDVDVGVLTDRPDLDMLISIWVHGFVATRVHDLDQALEVVDRDGVLLIDQTATSERSVIDELGERDFVGPAVLFGGEGAEVLEPGDRIVVLRTLAFSTMGQMLTLAQALTIAREGRANDPTVRRLLEADELEAAPDAEDAETPAEAEAEASGRFGETTTSAERSHQTPDHASGEAGHAPLWARVRSLLGRKEQAEPQPAVQPADEPHGHVSLVPDAPADEDELRLDDDAPGVEREDDDLTVHDVAVPEEADVEADEVLEQPFDLRAAEVLDHEPELPAAEPSASETEGLTAFDTSAANDVAVEDGPPSLPEDDEIWQPLPPRPSDVDATRTPASGSEEWDDEPDVPAALVTEPEEASEPAFEQPVEAQVPAGETPTGDALPSEEALVDDAQALPEVLLTEAPPTERALPTDEAEEVQAEYTRATAEDEPAEEFAAVASLVEEPLAEDEVVPIEPPLEAVEPASGADAVAEPPEELPPPRPLPFVDSDESGRSWILLDRIDPVVLDGGAIVMVLDDRGRLAPIAAMGIAPFEGAVTLPINHPLIVAAVQSGPVQLTTDRWLSVDDVPLSDCSVLVAIADKAEPRLLLIGSSRPLDDQDRDRIVEAFEDRATLQTVLRRVRPTLADPPWSTGSPEREHEPPERPGQSWSAEDADDGQDIDPAALRPWAVLNDADLRPDLGLAADRGFTRIVGDAAVAAWKLLNDVHHLTEGGGALIALRGTDGWFAPVATFRCQPVDAARSIPLRHPLLQRLRAQGGVVAVVNRPPAPSIGSGLPLSYRPVLMVFALGDPADPTGLLLVGRSRQPSTEEVAEIASALQEGRRPEGVEPPPGRSPVGDAGTEPSASGHSID